MIKNIAKENANVKHIFVNYKPISKLYHNDNLLYEKDHEQCFYFIAAGNKLVYSLNENEIEIGCLPNTKYQIKITEKLTSLKRLFYDKTNTMDLSFIFLNFDTSEVTNMFGAFLHCTNLESLDLTSWDTHNVTTMQNMFYDCSILKTVFLHTFDTSNVINMQAMFYGCEKLEHLDVSNWNTSKTKYFKYMFDHCSSLTRLDLSSFDFSSCIDMTRMFQHCESLEYLDISGLDNIVSIENKEAILYNCNSLKHIRCRQSFKDFIMNNDYVATGLPREHIMRSDEGIWEIIGED